MNRHQELARFFSHVAPSYERHTHLLTMLSDRRWRRFTVACMRLQPGDRVLDMSTGTGQLARLAARHPARPRVLALDNNPRMLELAQKKSRGLGIDFIQADARRSGLPANSFQAITMGFGLRIMDNRPVLLQEILRLLKPGGRAYFLETAHMYGWRRKFLHLLRPLLPNVLQYLDRKLLGYCYLLESMLEFPGAEDLRQLFISQGFAAPRCLGLRPALAQLHIVEKPHIKTDSEVA